MQIVDLSDLDEHIENLLQSYYQRLADGLDISPAERFRLEGYLQAVVECGLLATDALASISSRVQLQYAALADTQTTAEVTGKTLTESWHLPFQMRRAPVTPST